MTKVALPLGVMSFDGKSLWTSQQQQVPGLEAVASDEAGTPLWRLGTLRAVLTSVVAAPCVDLEFVGAKAGESPAFRQLLPRVVAAWGEHFQVLTADAGLTAAQNAALVRSLGKHYLLGLKGNQPTLYGHAIESLADKKCAPRARTEDRAHGQTVVRELWTHALVPGEVEFAGARLLLCVRQTHLEKDGTQSTEWRYFVTSLSTVDLSFAHLLRLVRLHWAIENRHHWTLDMVLEQDDRQPCLHSRCALEVAGAGLQPVVGLARPAAAQGQAAGSLGSRVRTAMRCARPWSGGGAPAHTRLMGSPAPLPSPSTRILCTAARPNGPSVPSCARSYQALLTPSQTADFGSGLPSVHDPLIAAPREAAAMLDMRVLLPGGSKGVRTEETQA